MSWLQIRFPAAGEAADALAGALEECGAISVSVEHVGDDSWVETDWDERPVWRQSRVTGLFAPDTDVARLLQELRTQLHTELAAPEVQTLADQDWADSWKANYRPLQVSERLWICPSWMAPPDPQAVNVILDPGMAFGTGDHPTTALCLEWLAAQDLAGKDVIDYGSGSGILAVAALKLGARSALGVELDELAIRVSLENAAQNGVADRFRAVVPALLPADASADIVIANILARPLMELAPRIQALVRPGGALGLSGLLAEQADEVAACYSDRFALSRRARGNWVLLAGRRTGE
jgi:ribosomal protein L11 methyltransferase